MSSDTTKIKTEDNSTNNTNDNASSPSDEDKSFYDSFKKYIMSFYNTNFLIIVLYVIMFLYYIHNNIYFLNTDKYVGKPANYIRVAGGILLVLFYVFFFIVIGKSSKDMFLTYSTPDNSYFSGKNIFQFIISLLVTFVILGFCLFVMPYYLTNAGFAPKGLMRVWNPFKSTAGLSNITSISNEKIKGYDTDGLYWGGDDISSKILFYFLSLPMVVNHFFFGNSIFNFWIIPALSGDSSDTETKWASDQQGPKLSAGMGWFFWILGLSFAIPLKVANFFSSFISKNMVYKYLNPVDWPLLKVISNPAINNLYNTTYFDTNFKWYSTKYYAYWTNAFVAVAILKVIFTSLIFPSSTKDIFHTNIQLLVITSIIGYVVIQFFKRQQNIEENYLDIFNFKSSGIEKQSMKDFQNTINNIANTTKPGILYPQQLTSDVLNIEKSNELQKPLQPQPQPQQQQLPQQKLPQSNIALQPQQKLPQSNIELQPLPQQLQQPPQPLQPLKQSNIELQPLPQQLQQPPQPPQP